MGAELVIDRAAEGYTFWRDEQTQDPAEWRRFGAKIRELTGGDDPDIVFEHPGRETFGASVFVAKRGGTIVTCASTSGFMHQYDNRYLWMNVKRIIGSHFANYREAWEANRLIDRGRIHPTLSKAYPMDRWVRRRTKCTATLIKARSACSASPPAKDSASATRRSGPGMRPPSISSADDNPGPRFARPARVAPRPMSAFPRDSHRSLARYSVQADGRLPPRLAAAIVNDPSVRCVTESIHYGANRALCSRSSRPDPPATVDHAHKVRLVGPRPCEGAGGVCKYVRHGPAVFPDVLRERQLPA